MKMTVKERQARIHRRIRGRVSGSTARPRLAVFRSNKGIFCQIIDDSVGQTLAAASSKETTKATKTEMSKAVGLLLAEKAKAAGVTKVVFDRGGYLYHGRVKALAEGAREGGLEF